MRTPTEDLIEMDVVEAAAYRWTEGREHYGPVWAGEHPALELCNEVADAWNYVEECERRGCDGEAIQYMRELLMQSWHGAQVLWQSREDK